jgi:large subunit ribosomal protein L1
MGSKRNVTVDGSEDKVKIVAGGEKTELNTDKAATSKGQTQKVNPRSKKYQAAKALVDRNKLYPPLKAFALLKKTSYASFGGTVSADLVLKEVDNQIKVSFPHATGKKLRVAIVNEDLITQIEAGKIDFEVLLTEPAFMPKLAKLARILGPKGLMPNPKNNTIVTDPEKTKKALLSGQTILKTQRKTPLLHVGLGKITMSDEDLVENLQALLKVLENKVVKVVISSSMSPGIKVAI